jgi:hypothetical protein
MCHICHISSCLDVLAHFWVVSSRDPKLLCPHRSRSEGGVNALCCCSCAIPGDSTSPLNDDFPYGLINPKQLFNIYLIRGIVKVSCYHISSLFGELLIWKLPVKWGKALVKPPWSSHWIPRRCQGLSWIAGRINVATWDQKRTSGTGTRWDEVFAASVSRVPGSSYTHQTLGAKPWKIVRLSKT